MTRLLREPFVHFLLLGCLIFAAYAVLDGGESEEDRIVIDQARLDHLRELWKIQWKREPNESETRALLERYVRQEVFYREALRMGLDRDDEIVRKRLAQKMEAVANDLGTLMRPPDEARLRAFHQEHAALFTRPASYAFEQVLFLPGEGDEVAALQALQAGGAIAPERVDKLGVRNQWSLTPVPELDNAFGSGFADALAGLPDGQWSGPVPSGYGLHLVRVSERAPPTLLPFEEVRDHVAREYAYRNELSAQDGMYDELRSRYTIEIPASGVPAATRAALGAR